MAARLEVTLSESKSGNGEAMPTDEDDRDGKFFFSHPERGPLRRA